MNLRDLTYLDAIATHLHFGKAAKAVHISQPTLSMQLKKLEAYLGVQLIERDNKRVLLTPNGKRIAEQAKKILLETEELLALAKFANNPTAGELHLGIFPTLAPYFLPHIVGHLNKQFPNLNLLLVEEKTAILLELLDKGKLDVAVIALPISETHLKTIKLFIEPFYLAVPTQHSLSKKKLIHYSDLHDQTLLLLEEGHCLREQALALCQLFRSNERQDFRATSLETLRQMVIANTGLTLIPELAVRKETGIKYIPFANKQPSRTLGLAFRKSSPRHELFIKFAEVISNTMKARLNN